MRPFLLGLLPGRKGVQAPQAYRSSWLSCSLRACHCSSDDSHTALRPGLSRSAADWTSSLSVLLASQAQHVQKGTLYGPFPPWQAE